MRRRDVLAGAGTLAVGATVGFPRPALSQGIRNLRMVTDWPEAPGMLPSARRLARTITDASDGRIQIEVFAAGALVRPFETFEAVRAGIADMYHSHEGYFEKRSPAYYFYSGVPFGLTATELFAWVRFGGGQALWDELSGQFDVKPLYSSSTGMQMGGWFRQPITSLDGFRGLRYRMAEPGAGILRRLGAVVVVLPGTEIASALNSGAIDACEWIGPWMDTAMGLNKAAPFYYYPGWHEPSGPLTLGINRQVWESFEASDQRLIEAAAAGEYGISLAEFNTNNAIALRKLRRDGTVKIIKFDDAILLGLRKISREAVAEAGAGDDLSRRIYTSYQDFQKLIGSWSDITEGSYLTARQAPS